MKNFFKFSVLGLLWMLHAGCAAWPFSSLFGGPSDPAEQHSWSPPSELDLKIRQDRQRELDAIVAEVEQAFLRNAKIRNDEILVMASAQTIDSGMKAMESGVNKKIDAIDQDLKQLTTDLAKVNVSGKQLSSAMIDFGKVKPRKKFSRKRYAAAIVSFKNGKYEKSIIRFQKLLKTNPPTRISDNIHFGIGASYYKLKKFEEAAKHFNLIVKKYPKGDKWPDSYVMMGVIHNILGEKSRAIYLLENALEKDLAEATRNLIKRLLVVIQEDEPFVSS